TPYNFTDLTREVPEIYNLIDWKDKRIVLEKCLIPFIQYGNLGLVYKYRNVQKLDTSIEIR
ncbi:MAG: hypothetical protein ACPGVN_01150, partial [Alphaproteobacteria bacterium]